MPKNAPKIIDYIQEYKNILSPKLCEQIIKYYDSIDGWNKSTFGTKDGLSPETNEKVDMDEQWITKKDNGGLYGDLLAGFKIALQKYTEKYPDIVVQHSTPFRMNRYSAPSGFMTRHIDNIHHSHGQRYGFPHVTMLMFMDDDYKGGEFSLCDGLYLKKPKAGTCITFPSNFMYPHEVKPVTEGTRHTVMVWLM
jgi:hypothetical protein